MKHFWKDWGRWCEQLRKRKIFWFLDFDGTLVSIASSPHGVALSHRRRALLKKIADLPLCFIAVVSGRALKDIKSKVNIKGIMYVGNHGLEAYGQGLKSISYCSPQFKKNLDKFKEQLKKSFSTLPGVWVEDKGLTLSVHYRRLEKKNERLFERKFREMCKPYLMMRKIKVVSGKKVFDIRPPVAWNKGTMVSRLLSLKRKNAGGKKILPVYVGDDKTDEDAFKVLKNRGITIVVGRPRKTHARYFLNNTNEVGKLLEKFGALRHD